MIGELLLRLVYPFYVMGASEEQQEYLPRSFKEYDSYKTKYGYAPGELIVLGGQPCLIQEIQGDGTINSKVTYRNLEEEQTYTVGLGDVYRRENRKI